MKIGSIVFIDPFDVANYFILMHEKMKCKKMLPYNNYNISNFLCSELLFGWPVKSNQVAKGGLTKQFIWSK